MLIEQFQREQELEKNKNDAELWRDLVSHQKFNNVKSVGYAINRTKERHEKKSIK